MLLMLDPVSMRMMNYSCTFFRIGGSSICSRARLERVDDLYTYRLGIAEIAVKNIEEVFKGADADVAPTDG